MMVGKVTKVLIDPLCYGRYRHHAGTLKKNFFLFLRYFYYICMCALTPPYYTPSSTYHIFIILKKKRYFCAKIVSSSFFFTIAQWTIKFEMRYRKIRNEATFPRIYYYYEFFYIFWFAILCLLIIKEFPLDVIFFLLFLVMLFCLFFFLLGIVVKMFSDVHIGRERLDADCRLAQRFLRHEQLIYFPLLFFCVCLFCCA
jgi:hypothetical protein